PRHSAAAPPRPRPHSRPRPDPRPRPGPDPIRPATPGPAPAGSGTSSHRAIRPRPPRSRTPARSGARTGGARGAGRSRCGSRRYGNRTPARVHEAPRPATRAPLSHRSGRDPAAIELLMPRAHAPSSSAWSRRAIHGLLTRTTTAPAASTIHTARMFDFLIVGAGSAGCVLANRLSAAGRTVALLEAGPPAHHRFKVRAPAEYLELWRSSLDWGFTTAPQS